MIFPVLVAMVAGLLTINTCAKKSNNSATPPLSGVSASPTPSPNAVADVTSSPSPTVTPSSSPEPQEDRTLAVGNAHACAILSNNTLKCWGANNFGQLGLGNTTNRGDDPGEMGASLPTVNLGTGRTAKSIAGGGLHTCAILDNGSVKCWGASANGELGLGDTATRGNEPGEMGDSLPTLNLGTGRTAVAIDANLYHTCAILDNGAVKCWGRNTRGQLGVGDTASRGDAASEMGDDLSAVSLGQAAVAVTTGFNHSCALLNDGTVKCWGANDYGQLGLGHTDDIADGPDEPLGSVDLGSGRTAVTIAAGGDHTCAVLDNDALKCWGRNDFGELGLGHTDPIGDGSGELGDVLPALNLGLSRTATSVLTGYSHTCAILDNESIKCWGANYWAMLGLGDTDDRGNESNEMGEDLPAVNVGTGKRAVALSSGTYFNCALFDDNSVKCWGLNLSGQLGVGDTVMRGDTPESMGDALPALSL